MQRRKKLARKASLKPKVARPRTVNRKRTAANFARAYGEKAAWIRALPCLVCGCSPSEAAHTRTGGMGRKADAATLVPLCGTQRFSDGRIVEGCHQELHRTGRATFQALHDLDLNYEAKHREEQWQAFVAGGL